GTAALPAELVAQLAPTTFLGYESLQAEDAKVVALLREGAPVQALAAGEEGIVVLDRTPFYAESGGQVGDTGELRGAATRFEVRDTVKVSGVFHGHVGRLAEGGLKVGDSVAA